MTSAFLIALTLVIVELPAIAVRIEPFRGILTKKQKITLNCMYFVILLISFFICFYAALNSRIDVQFYKHKLILCGMFLLLANLIVVRHHLLEHLFTCGVEATLSTIMPVLVAFLSFSLPPLDKQMAVAMNAVAYTMIYAFIYPFLSKLITNSVEPFLELKPSGYWGTICMIPMFLFIGNYLTYPDTSYVTTFTQFLGQLMIIAAVIMICLSVAKDPARIKSQNMMSKNMEMQKQYFITLTAKIDQARRDLHDSKYRVAAIEKFVETNDKEGLLEFCKTMIPKRYYSVELFHSGNAAVDGILFHYSQRAEQEGIKFKIAGTVCENQIPDDELSMLLGNAMENAFTACMTLEKDRFITFVAQSEAHVLSMIVQNSFDGRLKIKHGALHSRKRISGPGIGLESMQMICKKYGGTMELQWDDNTFTVLIILPVESKSEEQAEATPAL